MASALWAPAVSVYDVGGHKPDTLGYRLEHDPCRSIRLASLGTAIAPGATDYMKSSGLLRSDALDQVRCSIPLDTSEADGKTGGWHMNYTVTVTVALHKEADPGIEFEAESRMTELGAVPSIDVLAVPRLGRQAYYIAADASHAELRVLEGAAVMSVGLSVGRYYDGDGDVDEIGDGPAFPDLSEFRPAMIDDMRDLMASLKS
ncbi:hypothetical protein [Streptomyces sp. NPDC001068]|uniref:hypothetical protein n=1 Tax=Streptomyces sp. NPDC001068 TaxID=3364544 RepID=UPI0036BF7781